MKQQIMHKYKCVNDLNDQFSQSCTIQNGLVLELCGIYKLALKGLHVLYIIFVHMDTIFNVHQLLQIYRI